jgi:hypothetical protein
LSSLNQSDWLLSLLLPLVTAADFCRWWLQLNLTLQRLRHLF